MELCDGTRTLPQVLEGSSLDDRGTLRFLVPFKLPGVAHPFRTTGRVIWSSPTDTPKGLPAGMGIQFLDLSEEERGTLERFMVELLLDQAQADEPEA